jgi:ribosomal protein S27AE
MTHDEARNENDACPHCGNGTLERNENTLVCQGECGAIFPDAPGQAEADEAVKEINKENLGWEKVEVHWPDWLSAVPAHIGIAAKLDIGPKGEFCRMVAQLIERAYEMGRKMGQSDQHLLLATARFAIETPGDLTDAGRVHVLEDIDKELKEYDKKEES